MTADGRQIEIIEEQTGSMEPKTNFRLIVIQTELERFKFLVRSFLRARIAKVHSISFPNRLASTKKSNRSMRTPFTTHSHPSSPPQSHNTNKHTSPS
jgi:hypothetical protein